MDYYKILIAHGSINGLSIRQTDCYRTYEFMLKNMNNCRENIKDFSSLEIFEVMIRLTPKGLKNFKRYIYPYWHGKSTNIWEVRKLEKQMKYLIKKHETTRNK